MDIGLKRCTKCGEEKLLSEFYRDSRYEGAYRARCKRCTNIDNAVWRDGHVEEVKATSHEWYEAHRERASMNARRYREANREKVREAERRYYEANKVALLEYKKEWCKTNPDKWRAIRERYWKTHFESERERCRQYY